jgi:hypothetical protein
MMRRLQHLLLLCITTLFTGCGMPDTPGAITKIPPEWQTISIENLFTFTAPSDLVEIPVQGIDSVVGKYASSSIEINVDYGMWSNSLPEEQGWIGGWVTIDGKNARLVSNSNAVAAYFPKVRGDDRLMIMVTLKNADPLLAVTVLRSIQFSKTSSSFK